ncbi:HdeD family acid-resistance protein [Reyranella sp.]|uniref:HdeD family acid-resistance protein n=1 Tax=Reyranella sp. TaxID=1929291 RepID=UPI003BAC6A1E
MPGTPPTDAGRFAIEALRSYWLLFGLVGGAFILGAAVAICVPALSSLPPNEVLGLVLLLVGIAQIVQSGMMQRTVLFAWCLALGGVAAVGGVLVYIEPFPGIAIKTLTMALVFALHGATQIAFAVKIRRLGGWYWFAVAGGFAVLAGGVLTMTLPYGHSFTPATVGGLSLGFTGLAYITVAKVARRT